MKNKVITIARQYGSRGREIGEKLAKKLHVPFHFKKWDSAKTYDITVDSGVL